jgi:VPS inhibitor protein D
MQTLPDRQHSFTKVRLRKLNERTYYLELPQRRALVLSGGGAKCISYAGMIEYMDQIKQLQSITHIAGTSGGAFIGSFIAFGVSPENLSKIMLKTNYDLLRYEPQILYPVSGERTRAYLEIIYQIQLGLLLPEKQDIDETLQGIWESLKNKMDGFKSHFLEQPFNLFNFDDFFALTAEEYRLIDEIFAKFAPEDFISFKDLENLKTLLAHRPGNILKDLNVAVANRTLKQTKVYSVRTTPEDSVSLAVQISGAYPVLYTSTTIDGHELSDGGLYDNMPVALLYQVKEENFTREDIICVRADSDEDFNERHDKSLLASIEKVETYLGGVWDWMTGAETMTAHAINSEKQFSFGNMLYLNTGNVSTTSIDITEEERKQLIYSAFIQTANFFNQNKLVYNNPVLALLNLTKDFLQELKDNGQYSELDVYVKDVFIIKEYQACIINDLKYGETRFIMDYMQMMVKKIHEIQDYQKQIPGFQNLSKVEDDSILNMVLEQINHSSEGRYSDYLEYKEHENENIFSYLLWVIFRFFQIKLGIFFQDDRYTSPLLERTYVLEQTKKCLTPH